jgi:hypothetical protein
MQGYEEFKKVQHEKIAQFQVLEKKMKEINTIIERRMKPLLPKGKLKPLPAPKLAAPARESPPEPSLPKKRAAPYKTELDQLEEQLQDIEGQLQNVQ